MHNLFIVQLFQNFNFGSNFNFQDCKEDSIERTAWSIAEHALDRAFDPDYLSPFALQARKHGYVTVKGMNNFAFTLLIS